MKKGNGADKINTLDKSPNTIHFIVNIPEEKVLGKKGKGQTTNHCLEEILKMIGSNTSHAEFKQNNKVVVLTRHYP